MTDWYARPAGAIGAGDGSNEANASSIADARANLGVGGVDRILILDGTITTHIHHTTSGTQGTPLWWKAINPHQVILTVRLVPVASWSGYDGIDFDTDMPFQLRADSGGTPGLTGIVIKNFAYIRPLNPTGTVTQNNHAIRAPKVCLAHGRFDGEWDSSHDTLRTTDPAGSVFLEDIVFGGTGHTDFWIEGSNDYDASEMADIIAYQCRWLRGNHPIEWRHGVKRGWHIDCVTEEASQGEGDLLCSDNRHISCSPISSGGSIDYKSDDIRIWSEKLTIFGHRCRRSGSSKVNDVNGAATCVGKADDPSNIRKARDISFIHCSYSKNYAGVRFSTTGNTTGGGELGPIDVINCILDSNHLTGQFGTTPYSAAALYCSQTQPAFTGGSKIRGTVLGRGGATAVRWINGSTYTLTQAKDNANIPKATMDVEASCVAGDPKFVDVDAMNFGLQSGSPAISIGQESCSVTSGAGSTTALSGSVTVSAQHAHKWLDGNGCIDENFADLSARMGEIPCGHFWLETTTVGVFGKCTITDVNYSSGVIAFTVASDISWPASADMYHRDPTNGLDAGAEVFTAPPGGPPPPPPSTGVVVGLDAAVATPNAAVPASYTVSAGSNRCLVLILSYEPINTGVLTAISYGGQAMTKIGDSPSKGTATRAVTTAFVLNEAGIAAASGTTFSGDTFSATAPINTRRIWHVRSYEDVDQSALASWVEDTNWVKAGDSTGLVDPLEDTLPNIVDGMMVGAYTERDVNAAWTWGGGFTELTDTNSGTVHSGSMGEKQTPSGGTTTFSATASADEEKALIGIRLSPASSGTSPFPQPLFPDDFDIRHYI